MLNFYKHIPLEREERGRLARHGDGGWRKAWGFGGHGDDLRSGEGEENEDGVDRVCYKRERVKVEVVKSCVKNEVSWD